MRVRLLKDCGYGIQYNDGSWMMCVNPDYGIWYHREEIAQEVLQIMIDRGIEDKTVPPLKAKKPTRQITETSIKRLRRREVRMRRADRAYARIAKRGSYRLG